MHERTRQCHPQQIRPALQWTHDRRSAYRPRFGGRQNSVVTADLLGVPSRLKPLVAEEEGVRAVCRLIKNSIRLLIELISTVSLCHAVLPVAHHHSSGEIVDRDRDAP